MKGSVLSNISTLTVFRHAEAARAVDGQSDIHRELTVRGCRQAEALRVALAAFNCDLVLSSPSKRAYHTATIVSGQNPMTADILGIDGDKRSPLSIMYTELGNSPLICNKGMRGYFDHHLGNDLRIWARTALKKILDLTNDSGEGMYDVMICSHAVRTSALVWAIYEELGYVAPKCVTHINLGEAEAYRLTISTTGVPQVTLIAPTVPEPEPSSAPHPATGVAPQAKAA